MTINPLVSDIYGYLIYSTNMLPDGKILYDHRDVLYDHNDVLLIKFR